MKNKFYAVLHFLLAWLVRIIFNMRVKGKKNEPKRAEGPYLVCCNHQSVLDPVFICAAMRRQQPHFMAKAELFKVPVLSWLVRHLGAYPVSRGKNDVGAVKHTVALLKGGRSVGMFPQGTRCPYVDPRTTEVKSGAGLIAYRSGCDVLPVYIKTKKNRTGLFRRTECIIGDVIKQEELGFRAGGSEEYEAATELIFDRICTLGENYG